MWFSQKIEIIIFFFFSFSFKRLFIVNNGGSHPMPKSWNEIQMAGPSSLGLLFYFIFRVWPNRTGSVLHKNQESRFCLIFFQRIFFVTLGIV